MTTPATEHADAPADGVASPALAACETILRRAREELPGAGFNMWFGDLEAGELQGDVFELLAPNAYVKNWLLGHHMALLTSSAREALGRPVRVRIRVRRARRGVEPAAD